MAPKSKKLKISMKELLEKQGNEDAKTEGDPHQQDIQNDVPNFQTKEMDENSKKSEKSNQDSKKNVKKKVEGEPKKEVSLKSMIKQVTSQIFDERKKSTFLHQAVQKISVENSTLRLISLFQALHENHFKVFGIFKANGHQEMEKILARFSSRISDVLQQQKAIKMVEINSKKNDTKEDYSSKLIKYYNMQLKLKEDEIKRKKAFRDNAKKFNNEIQLIQSFIKQNSRIISEIVMRERFQTIINKMAIVNNELVAKKEKQCEKDMKFLFNQWRKMKQEKVMQEKMKRALKIEKMESCRKVLADKFPNLMGVLITPFSIFEKVK